MKPFTTIAPPHKDILEGGFTMNIFAADLWEVFKERGATEYKDSDIFFKKSYITVGLENLLESAEKRLKGRGGDSVIQLQTPFGGGKTHSLIALFHKSKEWNIKRVVLVGNRLDPKDTILWEEIEKQLTGEINKFKGRTPPGGEELKQILEEHQPLLILMDEIIEYVISAAGIEVGETSFATQILSFVKTLAEIAGTLDKTLLVFTFPSTTHYDEHGQRLLKQLQERTGRVEKPYTPVRDEEVPSIIRRRLFDDIKEKEEKEIVEEILDYFEDQKILPEGVEKSAYRERFLKSYPFQPEVIDVLYKRWGSFPEFQRTRGVLRILASVVHSLRESQLPYIRLADFDLANEEIKRELMRYIGQEFSGIISKDITSDDSAAERENRDLRPTHFPYRFGTKVATTIFMYSFSGGPEKGATIQEIKLSSVHPDAPASIIDEVIHKLSDSLYSLYLDKKGGRYYYTTEITLSRILASKIKSIEKIKPEERKLLPKVLGKEYFHVYIWPEESKDIPDSKRLKLIILDRGSKKQCRTFLENYGEQPRVYRNTLIFLCPLESERESFEDLLKKRLAFHQIRKDKTLFLRASKREELNEKINDVESQVLEKIKSFYRIILLPFNNKFKEIDLGVPTYGTKITINEYIYERLRSEEEILDSLAPLLLKERYLKDKDYIETKNLLETFFKTPGEIRISSEKTLKGSIKRGVKDGLFGLGEIEKGKPVCQHFRGEAFPELVGEEILIRSDLCKPKGGISQENFQKYKMSVLEAETKKALQAILRKIPQGRLSSEQNRTLQFEVEKRRKELEEIEREKRYKEISLKLKVPSGKLSDIVRLLQYLKEKFTQIDLKTEISAREGKITRSKYEDKVKEALKQADIEIEEERFR